MFDRLEVVEDPSTSRVERIVEYCQFRLDYHRLLSAGRKGQVISLIFVDADNLKQVNDTLGHAIGDRMIEEMGRVLSEFLPSSATICRKGGDEFIACFCAESVLAAEKTAFGVLWALNTSCQVGEHEMVLGCSVGLDTAPIRFADLDVQIKQADIAMYCAKRSGKGCMKVFDVDQCSAIIATQELSADFPSALRNGDLRVLYQPIFRIAERKIVGAEALVRWSHPTLGEVGAGQIIEIATKCGRLSDLGKFVLHTACTEAIDWPPDQLLNVNFSASDFSYPNFATDVISTLHATGLDAFRLRIEITEGEKLSLTNQVTMNIQNLRDYGVSIGIDDFGAGHASMASIDQYELDFIKIDRTLISRCDTRFSCKTFIKAIVKVAVELELEVVAEGIETLEEAAIVRGLGISWAQGFYYEPPIRPEALRKLFVRPAKDYFLAYRTALPSS